MAVKGLIVAAIALAIGIGLALPAPGSGEARPHQVSQLTTVALR